jgi:hypothetical protein
MRYRLIVMCMWLGLVTSAIAQVSIGIGLPGVSIGINFPLYPELVRVPGYPVYYAPQLNTNYFFYDGMYWVYQRNNWYASSWYNGPWGLVSPEFVPLFILRIPVRYYRSPPGYFRGWQADAPPRWGGHWGNSWQQQRSGWDQWNRNAAPAPAPLPVYQRQYSGARYPRVEQQPILHTQNYRYQPSDPVVRQHYQEQAVPRAMVASPPAQRSVSPQRAPVPQDNQRANQPAPQQQGAPVPQRSQPPQNAGGDAQRSAAPQAPPQQRVPAGEERSQQPQQRTDPREQQAPRSNQENAPQGKGQPQDERRGQGQGQGQDKGRDRGDERGQDRSR